MPPFQSAGLPPEAAGAAAFVVLCLGFAVLDFTELDFVALDFLALGLLAVFFAAVLLRVAVFVLPAPEVFDAPLLGRAVVCFAACR